MCQALFSVAWVKSVNKLDSAAPTGVNSSRAEPIINVVTKLSSM